MNLLWPNFGQICIVVNGQILKNNTSMWSQCLQVHIFSEIGVDSSQNCVNRIDFLILTPC